MFKRYRDLSQRVESAQEEVVISQKMLDEAKARRKAAQEKAWAVTGYAIYYTPTDLYPYTVALNGNFVSMAKTEEEAKVEVQKHIARRMQPEWTEGELIWTSEDVTRYSEEVPS